MNTSDIIEILKLINTMDYLQLIATVFVLTLWLLTHFKIKIAQERPKMQHATADAVRSAADVVSACAMLLVAVALIQKINR